MFSNSIYICIKKDLISKLINIIFKKLENKKHSKTAMKNVNQKLDIHFNC